MSSIATPKARATAASIPPVSACSRPTLLSAFAVAPSSAFGIIVNGRDALDSAT